MKLSMARVSVSSLSPQTSCRMALRETGRPSRFAYDEDRLRRLLAACGLVVEHVEVERHVQQFGSVEEALASAIGLEEKWRSDGRWFRYVKFLEEGGRTLTRALLIATARRA